MGRIAAHFGAAPPAGETRQPPDVRPAPFRDSAALAPPPRELPRLSIDEIAHPAYLVGPDFSLLWFNAASAGVLGTAAGGKNVLRQLLGTPAPARDEILRFHLAVARQHGATTDRLLDDLSAEQRAEVERLAREAQPPCGGFVAHICVSGASPPEARYVYAIRFREGILFAHVPSGRAADDLASLLQAREVVVGDLRRRRLPVLSDVAVVVMDLQHAPRIWSALPAEEYFELINQIWLAADPIVRRHRGTQGKHPRDGLACYFLRQRDASHAWNALIAAHEMREAMRRLSKEWQLRKGWSTELRMDTGVDEGQQWVGTLQSGAGAEFTMYGETLTRATALSAFARGGAIWATKDLLAKLTPQERQRLKWGIHHRDKAGHDVFVPAVFSTIERLAAPQAVADQWRDLAGLPITEIVDILGAEGRRERTNDQQPI
jgi:class 3 adenylate cyclase